MYSEQMMREQGFDDGPELPAEHAHRRDLAGLPDHPRRPDAPRRDLRSTRRPTSSSSRRASSAANARAEVRRYTYTPDLPAVVPARARSSCSSSAPTSRRRLGSAFSLRDFHDTLLRNGSLPISFHRRLLRERLGAARAPARAAADGDGSGNGGSGAKRAART